MVDELHFSQHFSTNDSILGTFSTLLLVTLRACSWPKSVRLGLHMAHTNNPVIRQAINRPTTTSSSNVLAHEPPVEIRPQKILKWVVSRRYMARGDSVCSQRWGVGGLTLMNSFFPLFSVPRAWFLNTTSSSHRRLMLKSGLLSSGFPRAMSRSRCSSSASALSRSCCSAVTR